MLAQLEQPTGTPTSSESPRDAEDMRLSALLRRGLRLHPQCAGMLYSNGATCAIGAIVAALDPDAVRPGLTYTKAYALITARLGIQLGSNLVYTPLWPQHKRLLFQALIELNDSLGWSRETIADWLEDQGY